MNYQISEDRKTLTLTVNQDERFLLHCMEEIQSDEAMYEFFEHFIANNELDWVSPEETGDLTNAPMLGLTGAAKYVVVNGAREYARAVYARWAWMNYQVKSLLEELRENGRAVLIS